MNDEDVVRAADQIVRSAWVDEMLRCRNLMREAVQSAYDYQSAAQRFLKAALREGSSSAIASAWQAVDDAAQTVRRNRAAAERLLPVIEQELVACAAQLEPDH
ncbi:MAG TPA: hypothetical protein VGX23_00090 [Actinocrinis sp.]|nr:hypothetical protein [Actinocrinis sp.]